MTITTSKECPFCGSADISAGEVWTTTEESDDTKTQSMCNGCGALGPEATLVGETPDYGDLAATEAWNRRAIMPPVPATSTPIETTRANFEDWYTTHAASIKAAPIGSRDSMLQWSAWLAADSGNYTAHADWKVAPLPWGPAGQLQTEATANSLRYPATMTAALADVLGLMNFRTGPIAHVYRAAGADIRTKCEDEHAFVLDRFLRLVLEHGDDWRKAAEADIKVAYTLAEANKAVES